MSTVGCAADVGASVHSARIQRGWSQAELARRADVSRQWLVALEQGHDRAEIGKVLKVLAVVGSTATVDGHSAGTVWTIRSLAQTLADEGLDWTSIRSWVDHLRMEPLTLPDAISEAPLPTGSSRLDNLLAGIVEREADLAGMSRPTWTRWVEPLAEPWTSVGTPRMQQHSKANAPSQFLARGIWLAAANVWRRNEHAAST